MFMRTKFTFLDVDNYLDMSKCKFIMKNVSFVFLSIFVAGTKMIFGHNFEAPLKFSSNLPFRFNSKVTFSISLKASDKNWFLRKVKYKYKQSN